MAVMYLHIQGYNMAASPELTTQSNYQEPPRSPCTRTAVAPFAYAPLRAVGGLSVAATPSAVSFVVTKYFFCTHIRFLT